ncbi:MAG TPA: restriction endonuclease [Verrucomicrobiae bacterium]|jgi:hypothetical protein
MASPTKYTRNPDELRQHASNYWPPELREKEAASSIIPLLIKTQEKFISLLEISDGSPDAWKEALKATKELPANLFLKHLMVLADVAGENLKRLRKDLKELFPNQKMVFVWQGNQHEYKFKAILDCSQLDNGSLFIDGKSLTTAHALDDRIEDVAMLLLHGASVIGTPLPQMIGEKCMIGSLAGKKPELNKFVRQRYIFVSRITGGATANALGQLAQDFVRDTLVTFLHGWQVTRNKSIPGISQNDGKTDMDFDILTKSPSSKYFAIEVSYQVTTNSVIERKSGQAQARQKLLHDAGHKIAYVIDGAGNFERTSALGTICQFSDCTVAFTLPEIKVLAEFLQINGSK